MNSLKTQLTLPSVTKLNARLKITLPMQEHYNVDNVLQIIAAELKPFSCGEICARCNISHMYENRVYKHTPYNCDGLSNRYFELSYLCRQLRKLISQGRFQVWDSNMRQAQEFPSYKDVSPSDYEEHFRYWTRSTSIFFDDLLIFLTSEKIHADFFTYSIDASGEIVENLCDDEETQTVPATAIENIPKDDRPKSAPKVMPIAVEAVRKKSQRLDYLAVEIDEILDRDPEMTPTQVYRALTLKIGNGNTCITACLDAGLRWKNSKGKIITASMSNVSDRVARWKKSNR